MHTDEGNDVLNNSFQLAMNAFYRDNPDIFYIDISKMYLSKIITSKIFFGVEYTVKICAEENSTYYNASFTSVDDVNNAIDRMNYYVSEIKSNAKGSNEEKIRYVHDYLVENVSYDYTLSRNNSHDAYGAIVDGISVCEGYAMAFKLIINDLGFNCMTIRGPATNSSNVTEKHAWNYVELDGKCYAVDVTWDDPTIIGDGKVDKSIHYKYYLKGRETFDKDHFPNGKIDENVSFKYPILSEYDY